MVAATSPEPPRAPVEGIHEFARVITLYGTLVFLGILGFYLVARASEQGFNFGFRSLAAILFPIIIASFLFVFNKELLTRIGQTPATLGFTLGLILGVAVMLAVRFFGKSLGLPVAELVTSGCFSVLVFSTSASSSDQSLSQYYGVISGILLYIILLGFPLNG